MATEVPWTYSAQGDIEERLEWLTDILTAWTGPEQRRRLREAPRVRQTFDSLEVAGARRQLENALAGNGQGTWLVPLQQDCAQLEAAWGPGDPLTFNVDARLRRFAVGGKALLIADDAATFDIIEVDAVTDTTLTAVAEPDHAWPAGTWIVPLVLARLTEPPMLARFTGDAAPLRASFDVEEPMDWTPDAGDATYRDLPVLELRPDWSRDPEWTPERLLDIQDTRVAPPVVIDRAEGVLPSIVAQFTAVGRDEIAGLRGLLYALAGSWAPIWIPTQAADFLVTGALAPGNSYIDVEWSGYAGWDILPHRRDIRIELVDGTVLYRRITEATELDPETERLALDSALGVTATADQVLLVSFLALARQDTDLNLLRYWKKEVVQTELRFRSFRADDV